MSKTNKATNGSEKLKGERGAESSSSPKLRGDGATSASPLSPASTQPSASPKQGEPTKTTQRHPRAGSRCCKQGVTRTPETTAARATRLQRDLDRLADQHCRAMSELVERNAYLKGYHHEAMEVLRELRAAGDLSAEQRAFALLSRCDRKGRDFVARPPSVYGAGLSMPGGVLS